MHARLRKFDDIELRWCLQVNRLSRTRSIHLGFSLISKLGDGWFWYALMAGLALRDGPAVFASLREIAVSGLAGLVIYKFLKSRFVRERPFVASGEIVCGTAPLDRYSFPSGHTLHAVNFTIMLADYAPETLLITVPFALLVMLSRIILGLHYPSDVLVGAVIGATLAHVATVL